MATIVNGKEYGTIADAFKAIRKSGAIQLTSDMAEDVGFYGNKRITLDLNGFKLTNVSMDVPTVSITGGATVTITDTSEARTGTIESTATGKGPVYIQYGSDVIIDGGNFLKNPEGNEYYIVACEGDCIINGGLFKNEVGNASLIDVGSPDDTYPWAEKVAKMTINGGEFISGFIPVKCEPYAQLTINGGTFKGDKQCILSYGTTTIDGGTFEATTRAVYLAGYMGAKGYVEIRDGDFSKAAAPIEIATNEGLEPPVGGSISGGTFAVAPANEFIAPGFKFITNPDGSIAIGSTATPAPNEDSIGLAFLGMRHQIIRRPTLTYAAGGIEVPKGIDVRSVLSATAKNGAVVSAYYEMATNRVLLFSAPGAECSGDLEDVCIVLIGN